jgi:glycosyltransferase involved in cell wall biosynthesis
MVTKDYDMLYPKHPGVLLVGNFLSASGYNRTVCEDLAEHLAELQWHILTTSKYPGPIARGVDMTFTAWRKRQHYSVAQIDVYSGLAFLWAETVCWILRRLDKPFILTLHGGNLPQFAHRWPARVKCLFQSAAVVTTPSRYLHERMIQYCPAIRLVPNPIDLSASTFQLRRIVQPKLVWLRAFHQVYNPTLAPKVLSLLLSELPDLQLTMIGPDKGDGSLQETQTVAQELGIIERINFPGGIPKAEVAQWLSQGDIFINTTNIDNTPVSVIEAMACGLCVISTNVGGIPYLLAHDQDALLVPPDDPRAMAAGIRRLLTEPDLAERLSLHARQKAEQFDWSVILPQWEALFKEVSNHA